MNKALATIALISAASAISLEGMKKPVGSVGGNGINNSTDTSGTVNVYTIEDTITEGTQSQNITETVGSTFKVCVSPCSGCLNSWVKVTSTYTNLTEIGSADSAGCITHSADRKGLNTIKYTWGSTMIRYFNVTVE